MEEKALQAVYDEAPGNLPHQHTNVKEKGPAPACEK